MPALDTTIVRGLVRGLTVTRRHSRLRSKSLFRYTGVGTNVRYYAFNNSSINIRRAVVERVFLVERDGELVPTPRPARGIIARRMGHFRRLLLKELPVLLPMSDAEFLSRYSGRRRKVYEKAVERKLARPVCKKDARLSGFVKFEGLKQKSDDPTEAVPRMIHPRDPVYNLELGKRIAHQEKPIFKAIAKVMGWPGDERVLPVVYKGMNAKKQGEEMQRAWDSFADPVALDLDASRFDQHVSRQMLEYEHSVFVRGICSGERKFTKWLLDMQLVNVAICYADDGKVKYTVEGCRMSGDMNTSSGNCLIMCALVYSFMRDAGVSKYRLVNNGDDCVLMLERKDFPLVGGLAGWFLEMGFSMKVGDVVDVLERVTFCQTQPVRRDDGYVMVRDPRTATAKDLTSKCYIQDETIRRRWCNAVRKGGKCLTAGIPVWPQFYEMFPASDDTVENREELGGLYSTGLWWLSRNMRDEEHTVGPEQRLSFWLAFGILPDEQVALENRYSRLNLGRAHLTTDMLFQDEITPLSAGLQDGISPVPPRLPPR